MALNTGSLWSQLSLNISPFLSGLSQAQSAVKVAGAQMSSSLGSGPRGAIDNTTSSVNKLGNQINSVSKDFKRIVGGIVVSQAFYRVINMLEDASSSLMRFSNNMQTATISLEYFLGTPERAKGYLEVMKEFAAWTPFTTEQSLEQSKRLMAMGFDPKEVKGVMSTLTDTASATGGTPEQMNRIVLALGQMRTNGYIAGQELRQLAEAGIPAYKILREELGLTEDQLRKIGRLKISGDLGIDAILTGLEKRYKGAADRIAETVPGMWSTIKDDALIIGEQIIKAPYNAFAENLRGIRDFFDKVRVLVRDEGLGGAFEKLFPPDMQVSIRNILASLSLLGQSFGRIKSELGNLVGMLNSGLLRALGLVLPIFSALASIVTRVGKAMIETVPAVRYLGAAIMGLMIARAASIVLMALWNVSRLGMICAAVGRAVTILRNAIIALHIAISANPIVGVVMLLAGALLYLALSSAKVSAWLSRLTGQLATLAGVNPGGFLNPEYNSQLSQWMDEYSQSLKRTGKDLKGVGDSAEEAGKKAKESLASFDEVYTLSKDAGDLGDVGAGIPEVPDVPDMPSMPELVLPEFNTSTMLTRWRQFLDELDKENKNRQILLPPIIWPSPPPPPPLPVEPWLTTLAFLSGAFVLLNQSIGSWASSSGQIIQGWASRGAQALQGWATQGIQSVSSFVGSAATAVTGWATATAASISGWAVSTATSFASSASESISAVTSWTTSTAESISLWASNMVTQVGTAVSTMASSAIEGVRNMATGVVQGFQEMVNLVISTVLGWISTLTATIQNGWNTITSGVTNLLRNMAKFWSDHKEAILLIIGTLMAGIVVFFLGLPASLTGALTAIAVFVTSSFVGVKDAVAMTTDELGVQLGTKWDGIREGLSGIANNLKDRVVGTFEAMKTRIKDSINTVIGFINGFIEKINSIEIHVPSVNIPLVGTVGGYTISMPQIPTIPQLKDGGIVDRSTLALIGEGGKKEAVTPLSEEGLRPFAEALASVLPTNRNNQESPSPILYVHTLIADDRGIKELERRFRIIQMNENRRRGDR